MTSASPSINSRVVMSPWHGTSGQCLASTARANRSISQNATVLNPPVLSRPRENPPIPLKRSSTLSFINCTPHHLPHLFLALPCPPFTPGEAIETVDSDLHRSAVDACTLGLRVT